MSEVTAGNTKPQLQDRFIEATANKSVRSFWLRPMTRCWIILERHRGSRSLEGLLATSHQPQVPKICFKKLISLDEFILIPFCIKMIFKKPSNRNKICHSLKKYLSQKTDFSMYFLCINIMLNVKFDGIWSNEIYLTCIQLV